MATKKYRIQQLQPNETLLTLHPETDASIVVVDKTAAGITATNVQAAIKELKDEIKTTADEVKDGVVTGVKGSAESTYRKGQVEITKANIGLSNVDNTSDADKPISTAVQAALDNVIQVAEGKTKTYVISASVNLPFASNEDTIKLSMQGTNITTTTGQTPIRLLELKLGDIVLLTDTDYPDRWVSTINGDLMWFDKLETRKIDLSGYALTTDIDNIKDGTTVVKKAEQDSEGNVIKDTYFKNTGGTIEGDVSVNGDVTLNMGILSAASVLALGVSGTQVKATSNDGTDEIALNADKTITVKSGSTTYAYDFPTKAGTVALVSDFSNYLSLNGGTMSGSIYSNKELALRHTESSVGFGFATFRDATASNTFTFLTTSARALYVKDIGTDAIAYEFTFPAKNGTVALVSDLESYLSKSGGIMTGDIQMPIMSMIKHIHTGVATYGFGFADDGSPVILNTLNKSINVSNTSLDVYNTYTFPDKDGTIALTNSTNGTYSAVQVTNGIVTAGANMIEIGATGVTTPSANLASGGIFFQEI